MITIAGQLAIKTIHGSRGDFNVGRLKTSVGEFVTKNAELDQYPEGKYEGDFNIVEFCPSMYTTSGRVIVEMRAVLGGMTLSSIDALTRDEAHGLSPQEVDPVDEEAHRPLPAPAAPTPVVIAAQPSSDPLVDTTPFGVAKPKSEAEAQSEQQADLELFGTLWPLGQIVKIDATVDRRQIRRQCARLGKMGYEFEPLNQEWQLKAA